MGHFPMIKADNQGLEKAYIWRFTDQWGSFSLRGGYPHSGVPFDINYNVSTFVM